MRRFILDIDRLARTVRLWSRDTFPGSRRRLVRLHGSPDPMPSSAPPTAGTAPTLPAPSMACAFGPFTLPKMDAIGRDRHLMGDGVALMGMSVMRHFRLALDLRDNLRHAWPGDAYRTLWRVGIDIDPFGSVPLWILRQRSPAEARARPTAATLLNAALDRSGHAARLHGLSGQSSQAPMETQKASARSSAATLAAAERHGESLVRGSDGDGPPGRQAPARMPMDKRKRASKPRQLAGP